MPSVLAQLNVNHNEDAEDEVMSTKQHFRKTIVTESDDEDEDEIGLTLEVSSDEDDSEDDSEDDDGRKSITLDQAMGRKSMKTPSTNHAKKRAAPQRRRRRSSARFLRLSGRFDTNDDEEEDNKRDQEQLGEMYKRAIRMNAENRINAGNSWGLNLIENIDKFLVDDPSTLSSSAIEDSRVNFTKASCTLDASVKIYAYRVDDVHLTSYKVLANLNRTESGKKEASNEVMHNDASPEEASLPSSQKYAARKNQDATDTIESNMANINMNKLDSAFDIDPLFHKMSKTFDEGGAKGLLLVNLGVGGNGCNIVFDSKDDPQSDAPTSSDEESSHAEEECPLDRMKRFEGIVDISSLSSKLSDLLAGSTVESLPLVPQLLSLREKHMQLDAEGFIDDKEPRSKSRRYASSNEEEKEAEQSIHQGAIERSRMSLANSVATDIHPDDNDQYASDDFGGDNDDNDDIAFTDFIGTDEHGKRYSSISFQNDNFSEDVPPGTTGIQSSATVLLDAMLSGDVLSQGGEYDYFSQDALEKITGGNLWAGSAHWKKREKLRQRQVPKNSEPKQSRRKKVVKERTFLDLCSNPECLDEELKHPTQGKRGGNPLQFSKAIKIKHTRTDNCLPPDAGIGLAELSKLFLRPNAVVKPAEDNSKPGKTVGFHSLEPFGSTGFDDGDDGSFGDDEGPGFEFADPNEGVYGGDDFVVADLEGVRKVDKTRVDYATIAKKVDVKRLKKDLWTEIENAILPGQTDVVAESRASIDTGKSDFKGEDDTATPIENEPKSLSFKETVSDLKSSQGQSDVTLPFYFICLLHLANEKGLRLESNGLEDFVISHDDGAAPSFGTLPTESANGSSVTTIAAQRERRTKETAVYEEFDSIDEVASSEL